LCRSDSSQKRPLVRQPCGVAKSQSLQTGLHHRKFRASSLNEVRLNFGFAQLICRNEPGLVPANFPSLSCARPRFSRPPSGSKTCKVGWVLVFWGVTPRSHRTPTRRTGRWIRARHCRTRTLRSDKCWIHIINLVPFTVQSTSSRPMEYMHIRDIYTSASTYTPLCVYAPTQSFHATQPAAA
jgi:hypothetical protein